MIVYPNSFHQIPPPNPTPPCRPQHHSIKGKKEDLSTSARRKTVDTSVTWLKKTVYLTNDPFDPVHQFKSEQQTQVTCVRDAAN